jgi:hypothetical protein
MTIYAEPKMCLDNSSMRRAVKMRRKTVNCRGAGQELCACETQRRLPFVSRTGRLTYESDSNRRQALFMRQIPEPVRSEKRGSGKAGRRFDKIRAGKAQNQAWRGWTFENSSREWAVVGRFQAGIAG